MYRYAFLFIATLFISLSVACSNDSKDDSSDGANESIQETPTQTIPMNNNQNAQNQAASSNTVVYHYICPNNCEGGGSNAQGVCPVCGTNLQHNQAYHDQPGQQQQQQQLQQNPAQQNPPPAQNASGEYHYICSAGCEGGAAAGGTCPKCGAAMQHNQAYHQ